MIPTVMFTEESLSKLRAESRHSFTLGVYELFGNNNYSAVVVQNPFRED